jgi:hypothetical protein
MTFTNFGGRVPRLAAELLPNDKAQTAENCKLTNGLLRPWLNDSEEYTCKNTGTIRTIYLHEGLYWMEWEADVDVVPGPVADDTTGRFYYTGHGIPKKTNTAEATTGGSAMPINFYPLAVPYGKNAPSVAAGSGGTGDPRNITYYWTCVTIWGEEGGPSPASDIVSAMNGQTVTVSGMTHTWTAGESYDVGDVVFASQLAVLDMDGDPVLDFEGNPVYDFAGDGSEWMFFCVTAGTSGASEPTWDCTLDADTVDGSVTWRAFKNVISSKRIYRLNTGDSTASYQYVGAIDVGESSFVDDVTDANLGDPCPTEDYDQPPTSLAGLTYLGNGIMLGFSGKDLYACDPYLPYSWPVSYRQAVAYPIVGIKSLGGTAVIATEGNPYIVTGTDPASLTVLPLPDVHACVSKRGMASSHLGITFPAPDGLVLVRAGGESSLFTQNHYTVEQWAEIYPSTLHGHIHDNRYFGFYSYGSTEGCIVLDLASGELTDLTMYCDAAYVNPETDELFFIKEASAIEDMEGGEITDFEGGAIEEP